MFRKQRPINVLQWMQCIKSEAAYRVGGRGVVVALYIFIELGVGL